MKIEILGSGCANCKKLDENARRACAELGIKADFSKVSDYPAIAAYGVTATPALVVDGKVKSQGRALSAVEIMELLGD